MNGFVMVSLGLVFFLGCFGMFMAGLYVFPRSVNHGRRSAISFSVLMLVLMGLGFWLHNYVFGHFVPVLLVGMGANFVASYFISRPPNLKKMQAQGDVEGLIEVMNDYEDVWLVIEAMDCLGDLGDERALDPLLAFRADENPALVAAMHENVVKFGDGAADFLVSRLDDAEHDDLEDAIPWLETLVNFDGSLVHEVLVDHMVFGTWRVALCSMRALVRKGWMWPIVDRLTELHYRVLVLPSETLRASLDETVGDVVMLRLPLHASEDVLSGRQFTNFSVIMGEEATRVPRELVEWAFYLRLMVERAIEAAFVPEAGIEFWTQACTMAPNYGFVWYGLGCVHALNEEKETALEVLEQAYLKTHNKNFEIYRKMAEVRRNELKTHGYIKKIEEYLHQI